MPVHLPPSSALFPYTTLFRSSRSRSPVRGAAPRPGPEPIRRGARTVPGRRTPPPDPSRTSPERFRTRWAEHTPELQSPRQLECRLLLEKQETALYTWKDLPVV